MASPTQQELPCFRQVQQKVMHQTRPKQQLALVLLTALHLLLRLRRPTSLMAAWPSQPQAQLQWRWPQGQLLPGRSKLQRLPRALLPLPLLAVIWSAQKLLPRRAKLPSRRRRRRKLPSTPWRWPIAKSGELQLKGSSGRRPCPVFPCPTALAS